MATARDSAFYTSQVTNKYLQQPAHRQRVVGIPFEFVVLSTSAGADTYNLAVIKANEKVVGLDVAWGAMGASAGAGRTMIIGDSGDDDRYLAAADVDVAGSSSAIALAGEGYRPTADTVVVAKAHATNAWVVGASVKGCIYVVAAEG